jgi:hypothetical protein
LMNTLMRSSMNPSTLPPSIVGGGTRTAIGLLVAMGTLEGSLMGSGVSGWAGLLSSLGPTPCTGQSRWPSR